MPHKTTLTNHWQP